MTITLWDFDACLCGNPLPRRPVYRKPAEHCSYWCFLVSKGIFTLEQITPMLPDSSGRRMRQPISLSIEVSQ